MPPNNRTASVRFALLVALATLAAGWYVGARAPRVLKRQGQSRSGIHWDVLPDGRVWGIANQPGYAAQIEPLEKPTALRVQLLEWNGPQDWKVQLVRRPVALRAGKTYELSFRIRAEGTRPFTVCVGRPTIPSDERPLAYRGELTDEWQNVSLLFTPAVDSPEADLWFELGDSSAAVLLEDVALEFAALEDAALVEAIEQGP